MIMCFDLIAHILHTLLMKSLCSRKEGFFNHVQDVVLDNGLASNPSGIVRKAAGHSLVLCLLPPLLCTCGWQDFNW